MNCVICAIARYEDTYLYEWASYHIGLGFKHIYLYDNNDLGSNSVSTIFSGSAIESNITVINVQGRRHCQKEVYNECYHQFPFDWCAFIDIDEFITLDNNYSEIQQFIFDKSQFDAIHLNWLCYGDNGHCASSYEPVVQRFKKPIRPFDFKYSYIDKAENSHIKSLIKKGLDIDWAYDSDDFNSNPHTPYGLIKICNAIGEPVGNTPFSTICLNGGYIRHYTTKTIQEYQSKIKRQCADCDATFYSTAKFFRINSITPSKVQWMKHNEVSFSLLQICRERLRFLTLNYRLPIRFLFRSLRNK